MGYAEGGMYSDLKEVKTFSIDPRLKKNIKKCLTNTISKAMVNLYHPSQTNIITRTRHTTYIYKRVKLHISLILAFFTEACNLVAYRTQKFIRHSVFFSFDNNA